jgi:hypothetical protein
VVATGLEDGTLTISTVLLFICHSAPQNLLRCHKNSQIEASTSCLSIHNTLGGGGGLSRWLCCGKRQGAAHAKEGPFVGPLPAKG